MKQVSIIKVPTWHENEQTEINVLQINNSNDNLVDSCEVSYSFISVDGKTIANKKIVISGEAYHKWDGNIDYVITAVLQSHAYQKL
jgi:hypothetical protein